MLDNRLLVLSGPTASGKTALAISLARILPLEIVNADSLQVYRGMDIGTAKPSAHDRLEIPHHLIDVASPDEEFNAGRFVDEADRAILAIRGRGRFPLVAGGTGMYIRALLRGLDPLPSDPVIRAGLARRWREEGEGAMFAELAAEDPESAGTIHPSDRVRVLRALEIAAITGDKPSRLRRRWTKEGGKFRILFIALSAEREKLYRRIEARVDDMFSRGLVEEVRGLLSAGYGPDLKPMNALGYRHVISMLSGAVSREQAVLELKRDTRRYAKRQLSWLSSEPEAAWMDAENAMEKASALAKKFLF